MSPIYLSYRSPVYRLTRPEEISRDDLISIALEWGIKSPDQKTEGMLTKEIWQSQVIQLMYQNDGKEIETECPVDSKRKFPIKWSDGIKLRKDGLDFGSLNILLKKKIFSIDQLKTFTSKQIVETLEISPAFAILLANKYSIVEKSNFNGKEKQLNLPQQQALKRINKKKWPNREKQLFIDFVNYLEYDLRILDPSKNSWIDHITVLLENETREEAEKLRSENPSIEYEEWKEKLTESTITQSERVEAVKFIVLKKYNFKTHPDDHFKKLERCLKIAVTNVTNEIFALFLLMTLPYNMRLEMISDRSDLDVEHVKSKIIATWFTKKRNFDRNFGRNFERHFRSSRKPNWIKQSNDQQNPPIGRNKCDANNCRSTTHKPDECWFKFPEKRPKVEVADELIEGIVKSTLITLANPSVSSKPPIMNFTIKNVEVEGVFVTGTITSMISKKIAVEVGLLAYPSELKFNSYGHITQCEWFVPLKVYDCDKPMLIAAYIIDDLRYDMIIGANIMLATQLCLSSRSESWVFKYSNTNRDYKLRVEMPNLSEIKMLLYSWYQDNYDINQLHRMSKRDLVTQSTQESD